jgi:uncharacterized repeat protein (TIGR01451 family)
MVSDDAARNSAIPGKVLCDGFDIVRATQYAHETDVSSTEQEDMMRTDYLKVWKVIAILVFVFTSTTRLPLQSAYAARPWYVASTGDDGNSCSSPSVPCSTINGAISKAISGDIIYVAAGIYTNIGPVVLDKSITLSGGWSADFTEQDSMSTIDGTNTYYGILVTGKVDAIIERFVVQNCTETGIFNSYSSIAIDSSAIRNNPMGIYANGGTLILNRSSISGNTANNRDGGGIRYNGGTLILNNSTISNNQAISGGGVSITNVAMEINSSTIAGNTAFLGNGGGILNYYSTVTLRNSILAKNIAYGTGQNCRGSIDSAGYNLVGDVSGCAFTSSAGDLTDVDPLIGLLRGLPAYRPLLPGSPGVNAGNPSGCMNHQDNVLLIDQRGMPRVGQCDIGAYEAGLTALKQVNGTLSAGGLATYTVTLRNDEGQIDLTNVCLTDTLSVLLSYVPDSLSATNGTASENEGTITWRGNVLSTTDTLIAFQTTISNDLLIGTVVTNTAMIDWCNKIVTANAIFDTFYHTHFPLVAHNYYACPAIFFDDFSDPTSGWPIGEDNHVRFEYLSGEYRISTKQDGYLYLFRAPTCDRQNYIVEVDARWNGAPGSSYGIIFGITGNFDEYYLFDINTDIQQFRLYHRDSTGFVEVAPATYSSAIHNGTATNHLKIARNSGWISLYVNGTRLGGTWPDNSIYTNRSGVGLISSPYFGYPISDARFDNFRVTALPDIFTTANTSAGLKGRVSEGEAVIHMASHPTCYRETDNLPQQWNVNK